MTDREPGKIIVPGSSNGAPVDDDYAGLVRPEDLGSASRSCFAIMVVLLVIALLACVFLIGTIYR